MHLNCHPSLVEIWIIKLSTCLHPIYAELHHNINLVKAEHGFQQV